MIEQRELQLKAKAIEDKDGYVEAEYVDVTPEGEVP